MTTRRLANDLSDISRIDGPVLEQYYLTNRLGLLEHQLQNSGYRFFLGWNQSSASGSKSNVPHRAKSLPKDLLLPQKQKRAAARFCMSG